MPYPDVFWYCLNGMGAQKNAPKKVLVTLFPYIFHIETKSSTVYENLKTKILSRDTNILPQMHWTSNIFGPSATTIGVFWVSLNYPTLNFKKTVCPKNVWMQHWRAICLFASLCVNTSWNHYCKHIYNQNYFNINYLINMAFLLHICPSLYEYLQLRGFSSSYCVAGFYSSFFCLFVSIKC